MTEELFKRHPNTAITRSFQGDPEYASTFQGPVNVLLFQMRNNMMFNSLEQHRMTRVFTDGTVITAWSFKNRITGVYQDFVNVDVRNSTATLRESCTITYIDLPPVVSPMRYPRQIMPGEVEGQDYIKTYYILSTGGCATCDDEPTVEFEFQFVDATIEHQESPHDEEEHCIVSEDGGCFAEIIDQGEDDGGTYIIWKAYTEGSSQNRSGYGFVKLTATVPSENKASVCTFDQVIKVDCCVREGLAAPELYWEPWDLADCSTFITYKGKILCKVPDSITVSDLVWFAVSANATFYVVGGCPRYTWEFSGFGTLTVVDNGPTDIHWSAIWQPPADGSGDACNSTAAITVTDRCLVSDTLNCTPCCASAVPLAVGYTSLAMSCGQLQTLTATGGCDPYSWSLSGGGSLNTTTGREVIYTAPATNPNCSSNPTITVTDCCGNSASVSLAVNCWSGAEGAIGSAVIVCCTQTFAGFPPDYLVYRSVRVRRWRCDGVLLYDCETNPGCVSPNICPYPCTLRCEDLSSYCYTSQCGGACGGTDGTCGTSDCRTAAMLAGGCCPLNPDTGLPY